MQGSCKAFLHLHFSLTELFLSDLSNNNGTWVNLSSSGLLLFIEWSQISPLISVSIFAIFICHVMVSIQSKLDWFFILKLIQRLCFNAYKAVILRDWLFGSAQKHSTLSRDWLLPWGSATHRRARLWNKQFPSRTGGGTRVNILS